MEKPSMTEKIMGSSLTKGAATLLAATAPYAPIAAVFLPLLCDSFAHGRYQVRMEKTINELQAELAKNSEKIVGLSDAQYKFINETVATLLQTLEEEKLSYLKCAIRVCVHTPDMSHKEASVMSRIIRDISADEIRLLVTHSQSEGLALSSGDNEDDSQFILLKRAVLQDTPDNKILISGLHSLGLLVLDDNVFANTYAFSPIVGKLLALVTEEGSASFFFLSR
jgi:hypothetical protein